MIAAVALGLLAQQVPESLVALHPAEPVLYTDVPDVQALLGAYDGAPAVRMLLDPDVRAALVKLEEALPLALGSDLGSVLTGSRLALTDGAGGALSVVELLKPVRALSVSFSLREESPGELRSSIAQVNATAVAIEEIVHRLGSADTELAESLQQDAWGRAYAVERDGERLHVVSHGADGVPGGVGANVDIDENFDLEQWLQSELLRRSSILVAADMVSADAARASIDLYADLLGAEAVGEPSVVNWCGGGELRRMQWHEPLEAQGWTLLSGSRALLSLGATTTEDVAARWDSRARSLRDSPRLTDLGRIAGAATGPVVSRGFASTAGLPPQADLAQLSGPIASTLLDGLGSLGSSMAWRMQLVGERFVTDVVSAGSGSGWTRPFANRAVSRDVLAFVPGDAVGVIVTQVDGSELFDEFARLAGFDSTRPDGTSALAAVEEQHQFSLQHDLFDNLTGSAALYLMPITSIGWPNAVVLLELGDAVAFERGVRGLVAALEAQSSDVTVKSSSYRGAALWTFRSVGSADANPLFPAPTPTLAIVQGRAIVTPTSLLAKREIKRALGEESAAQHALAGGESGAPPDATIVAYMDWGGALGSLYKTARAGLAVFGSLVSTGIDTAEISAALPEEPQSFTRFFAASRGWGRPVDAGFHVHWEASFGPETWLGLTSLVMGSLDALNAPPTAAPETDAAEAAVEPAPDGKAVSLERLRFLAGRLTVYRIDETRFPASLDDLCKPTANYPRGFLDSDTLPTDGWGRAFHYEASADRSSFRLWSVGADGIDDAGAGDDLLAP